MMPELNCIQITNYINNFFLIKRQIGLCRLTFFFNIKARDFAHFAGQNKFNTQSQKIKRLIHLKYIYDKGSNNISPPNISTHKFYPRVKNLSDINFSNQEMGLLMKGLKFCPPKDISNKSFERLAVDTEITLVRNKVDTIGKSVLAGEMRSLQNNTLNNFSNYNHPTHFSKIYKSIQLKINHNNLLISKADKGNTLVIMKHEVYHGKIMEILNTDEFQILPFDPTKKFHAQLKQCITSAEYIFPKNSAYLKERYIPMNPVTPLLYGLPKIHKDNIPLRPVVSYIGAPAYKLAKFLNDIIKEKIQFTPKYSVNNSLNLIDKIKNIKLSTNSKLFSLDVESLFTNVPYKECLNIIKTWCEKVKLNPMEADNLITLTRLCMSQNYFCYNNTYYIQKDGLTMGSPLSPLLADIFMDWFENEYIVNSNNHIKYYFRYVDDIILCWTGTVRQFHLFVNVLNTKHPKIKFKIEQEINNSINFLDVTITRLGDYHDFSVYRKPTHTDVTIPIDSFHPWQHKLAAYKSMIHRSSLLTDARITNAEVPSFPKEFVLGAATSSFQVEGAWDHDGKGESIWDHFIHTNTSIVSDASTADVAANSYYFYKRDVQVLKELGAKAYRFSISWPRILPNGIGEVNPLGIAHYNALIDELLANDILPFVTMYHWELPQVLSEEGGWLNKDIADWFGDYARILYQNFGDRVKHWMTINEPHIHCNFAYGVGAHAPGFVSPGIGYYECGKNILRANARAYHIYDDEFRAAQGGEVGIVLSMDWALASTDSQDDAEAVEDYFAFKFGQYMDPIFTKQGNYPKRIIDRIAEESFAEGLTESRLLPFTDEEADYIRGTSDFLGLNSYSTEIVYRNESLIGSFVVPSVSNDLNIGTYGDPSWPVADETDWLREYGPGLYFLLLYIKDNYKSPKIYITENGFSTSSGLNDDDKVRYLRDYLSAVMDAASDGVDVQGYFAWSLLDTFEWTNGYILKFGLYEIDFEHTFKTRTPRKSALVYEKIISSGTIDYNYNPDPYAERFGSI